MSRSPALPWSRKREMRSVMVDDLERLEETIAVQADDALIRQLTASEQDLAAGRVDDELLKVTVLAVSARSGSYRTP